LGPGRLEAFTTRHLEQQISKSITPILDVQFCSLVLRQVKIDLLSQ